MGNIYLNSAIDHYESWLAAHSGPSILQWKFLCGYIGENMREDAKFGKTLSAFMHTQFRGSEAQIYWFPGGCFIILFEGKAETVEAIFNAWNRSMAKQFAATAHEFKIGSIRDDPEDLITALSIVYRRLKRVNPLVKILRDLRTPEGDFIEYQDDMDLGDVVSAITMSDPQE